MMLQNARSSGSVNTFLLGKKKKLLFIQVMVFNF